MRSPHGSLRAREFVEQDTAAAITDVEENEKCLMEQNPNPHDFMGLRLAIGAT